MAPSAFLLDRLLEKPGVYMRHATEFRRLLPRRRCLYDMSAVQTLAASFYSSLPAFLWYSLGGFATFGQVRAGGIFVVRFFWSPERLLVSPAISDDSDCTPSRFAFVSNLW